MHDCIDGELGRVVPYGVYHLTASLRPWRLALQRLLDGTGQKAPVCHFPSGSSEWNKFEHCKSCHTTNNWRGRPMLSHQGQVNLIGSVSTARGLRVTAAMHEATYDAGIKVSSAGLAGAKLVRDTFHGQWNCPLRLSSRAAWGRCSRHFCQVSNRVLGCGRAVSVALLGERQSRTGCHARRSHCPPTLHGCNGQHHDDPGPARTRDRERAPARTGADSPVSIDWSRATTCALGSDGMEFSFGEEADAQPARTERSASPMTRHEQVGREDIESGVGSIAAPSVPGHDPCSEVTVGRVMVEIAQTRLRRAQEEGSWPSQAAEQKHRQGRLQFARRGAAAEDGCQGHPVRSAERDARPLGAAAPGHRHERLSRSVPRRRTRCKPRQHASGQECRTYGIGAL